MKTLLFGAAIAMIAVSSALAGGGMGGMDADDGCKGCPSWRSPASDHAPPWWLTPGPAGYSSDYKSTLTVSRHPVVIQQIREGERVRARVTHVPRLGRTHRLNESR